MGASAREIERQITETRERLDRNVSELEGRTRSNAVRYGRIAAAGLALALVAGIAFVMYRRTRRPSLIERFRAGARGMSLRDRLPTVTLRVNEQVEQEPGTVEKIVREVAPALAGTAGSALLERLVSKPDE
jgi:hypothetical protein